MLRFFCPTARQEFDSGIILDHDTYQRNRLKIAAVIDLPLNFHPAAVRASADVL